MFRTALKSLNCMVASGSLLDCPTDLRIFGPTRMVLAQLAQMS